MNVNQAKVVKDEYKLLSVILNEKKLPVFITE